MQIKTDNPRFDHMVRASMESIVRRQDRHTTGAIPESDADVFNGFSYRLWGGLESATYTRSVIGSALCRFGETGRLRRLLDFYAKAQADNGQIETAMQTDVPAPASRSGRYLSEAEVNWLRKETDTTAYAVWHASEYFLFTEDREWLRSYWPVIKQAVSWLLEQIDPSTGLVIGLEEIGINDDGQEVDSPFGFMTQICGTVKLAFRHTENLALVIGDAALADRCKTATENLHSGMEKHLWCEEEGRYFIGMQSNGKPYRDAMYFTLFPAYLDGSWSERDHLNLHWLWPQIYNRDHLLPGTVYVNGADTQKKDGVNPHSGVGPWIGAQPVLCELLMRDGQHDLADALLQKTIEFTDDTGLVPEHINTVCLGKELASNMRLWPDPTSFIDRGNLMHLSFFLQLVATIVGVGAKDKTGVVGIRPAPLACLGTIHVTDAPLPGGGNISFSMKQGCAGPEVWDVFSDREPNQLRIAHLK